MIFRTCRAVLEESPIPVSRKRILTRQVLNVLRLPRVRAAVLKEAADLRMKLLKPVKVREPGTIAVLKLLTVRLAAIAKKSLKGSRPVCPVDHR